MCDNRRLIFFSLMLLLIACVSQKSANLNVSSRNYFEDLAYIRSEEINKKKDFKKIDTITFQNKNDISIELDSIIVVIKSESKKKQSIDGYTIQLYLGDNRTLAEEIEGRINEIDSIIFRKIIFTQPNYRVKVGSYYDRFLVNKEFKKFKEKFPDAIIIPEKIKFN
jgi:hypothetical protein